LTAGFVVTLPAGASQLSPPTMSKVPAVKATALVPVRAVSRTVLPHGERVVIEFADEVSYSGERVDSPDRVYLDFASTQLTSGAIANARAAGGTGLVSSVRIAQHAEQVTRVVLQLAGHPRYSVFTLYSPFRIAIDIEPMGADEPAPAPQRKPAAAAAAPAVTVPVGPVQPPAVAPANGGLTAPLPMETVPTPATPKAELVPEPAATESLAPADEPPAKTPAPTPAPPEPPVVPKTAALPAAPAVANAKGDYSLARQLGLGVARVVIDPGHGGHDPGAQSNGVTEAELVLDVALRLEKLLIEQHVAVVMTRRTDEFIPLEERTAIANRECADLFLSIHANASQVAAARGVETYFLNFTTNPAAEAVAARENATSTMTMTNLPELVKTIAMNNKVVESRELATLVQSSTIRRLRLQNKTVKDLGVKQAAFVVLIGAQMPSVLAEISFVTNKSEAGLLKQPAYRQRIAQGLMEGLVKYQTSLKKVSVADARKN
jgi:N-acetylmuramoyl-L-alanine amidase